MIRDALFAEIRRATTLRSTPILLVACLIMNSTIPIILLIMAKDDTMTARDGAGLITGGIGIAQQLPPLPAIMLGLLGALMIGNEFRYNTIQPTLLATPMRSVVVFAKVVVAATLALTTAALSLLINMGLVLIGTGKPVPLGGQSSVIAGFLVLMLGWAILGFGITLLARRTIVAISFLFLMTFVVENLVRAVLFIPGMEKGKFLAKYLPFSAGTLLARPVGAKDGTGLEQLSRADNASLFIIFVTLILAAGWVRFVRRDA